MIIIFLLFTFLKPMGWCGVALRRWLQQVRACNMQDSYVCIAIYLTLLEAVCRNVVVRSQNNVTAMNCLFICLQNIRTTMTINVRSPCMLIVWMDEMMRYYWPRLYMQKVSSMIDFEVVDFIRCSGLEVKIVPSSFTVCKNSLQL